MMKLPLTELSSLEWLIAGYFLKGQNSEEQELVLLTLKLLLAILHQKIVVSGVFFFLFCALNFSHCFYFLQVLKA